jgi:hypothetical protein
MLGMQGKYVVPGMRMCDHQVERALTMNSIQTINSLRVQEIQYFKDIQFLN